MTTDKDWIEWKWTPEKPYPETLEIVPAMVRYRDGTEVDSYLTIEQWYCRGHGNFSHEFPCDLDIVAYKLASEEN